MTVPQSLRRAYRPSLVGISLLDAAMLRAPFVIVPLIATPLASGAFAALSSAQQTGSALVTTGLYTAMTMRSGSHGHPAKISRPHESPLERILIIGSLPLALGAVAATPLVLKAFNLSQFAPSPHWWILLVCALPLISINRAAQYYFLSIHRRGDALAYLGVIASVAFLLYIVGLVRHDITTFASAPLLSESAGLIALVAATTLRAKRLVRA